MLARYVDFQVEGGDVALGTWRNHLVLIKYVFILKNVLEVLWKYS